MEFDPNEMKINYFDPYYCMRHMILCQHMPSKPLLPYLYSSASHSGHRAPLHFLKRAEMTQIRRIIKDSYYSHKNFKFGRNHLKDIFYQNYKPPLEI